MLKYYLYYEQNSYSFIKENDDKIINAIYKEEENSDQVLQKSVAHIIKDILKMNVKETTIILDKPQKITKIFSKEELTKEERLLKLLIIQNHKRGNLIHFKSPYNPHLPTEYNYNLARKVLRKKGNI